MKRRIGLQSMAVVVFALGLAALGCDRSSPTAPSAPHPSWVGALIVQIQNEPVTSPPSSLLRYRYHGETVYFRPARCCDIWSDLYDRHGVVICHPDGGIVAGGDGRCTDFFADRREEELVWQDPRH